MAAKKKSPVPTKKPAAARKKPRKGAGKRAKTVAKTTAPAGSADEIRTIVYIHGVANKPKASVLKCQWDTALFGTEMGERTRMAYWVDPEVHPVPKDVTCSGADVVPAAAEDEEPEGAGIRSARFQEDWLEGEVDELASNEEERAFLKSMGGRLIRHSDTIDREESAAAAGPGVKVLPLPPFLRRRITRAVTKHFVRDAFNFFFNADKRERMEEVFLERLASGEGPIVVIAHSQGSMIAYNVLRRLKKADCDVRLFITIGSPLGLAEVKDLFRKRLIKTKTKLLPVPACVRRWVNIADRADVVALDETLSSEFRPKGFIKDVRPRRLRKGLNRDSPKHPHSATGYLRSDFLRQTLREEVGASFGSFLSDFVIASDLASIIEDDRWSRHSVLIQLVDPGGSDSLTQVRERVLGNVRKLVAETEGVSEEQAGELSKVDPLRRYVAAELTGSEIEKLRATHTQLAINRLWHDSGKAALVRQSARAIQVEPARIGYEARGTRIRWAVLDTGVDRDHPHFATHDSIKEEWDCTRAGAPVAGAPDGHGHGTHVAGIVAGEHQVASGEVYRGMAPEADLVIYKVLADNGRGQDSWIIKGLEDVARKNEAAGKLVIHGVNLSLGGPFDPSVYGCGHSPICQELRRLWRQGVVVALAAGNEGFAKFHSAHGLVDTNVDLSIGDPANLEEAISVGSVHKRKPHTYGVSYFSSRGPTADGRVKPDVVAPGEKILSARALISGPRAPLYVAMDGTSMAAPHVSGLIAAFLSVRREFIGYPDKVKEILLGNCIDLERDRYIQGHGMPNLIKMLANT